MLQVESCEVAGDALKVVTLEGVALRLTVAAAGWHCEEVERQYIFTVSLLTLRCPQSDKHYDTAHSLLLNVSNGYAAWFRAHLLLPNCDINASCTQVQ